MNILVDQLPDVIEIEGKEYPINTDFRTALRIIMAFEDPELAAVEKQIVLLDNLYQERPGNLTAAFEQGIRFLNMGEEQGEDQSSPRVYAFSKDANFIFSAFSQTHNIALANTEYMHWWQFLALFMDLGSETTFCQLVSLRKRVKTGKASKEERAMAREMGTAFELPEIDDRTLEEREQEASFMQQLVRENK